MGDREHLEQLATETISNDLYYDLCDTIDSLTDDDLYDIIGCGGNYKTELRLEKELVG
jgi:hypothetical protein